MDITCVSINVPVYFRFLLLSVQFYFTIVQSYTFFFTLWHK